MLVIDNPITKKALDLDSLITAQIKSWPRGNSSLADQIRRASESIGLRFGEGLLRPTIADRAHFFGIARASAGEVIVGLAYARGRALIDARTHSHLTTTCDGISAMLWKLIQRERERAAAETEEAKGSGRDPR